MGIEKQRRKMLVAGEGVPQEITGFTPGQISAIAALAEITTEDATDEAEAIALVNEAKAKINDIISALKS